MKKAILDYRISMHRDSQFEEAAKSRLMRRAFSFLMMMVMVLAPCATAHAATMSPHPSTISVTSDAVSQANAHAMPKERHEDHAGCHETGHAACAGDCDTLQRASSINMTERVLPETAASFSLIALTLIYAHAFVADDDTSAATIGQLEAHSDSKTVLRRTARLRL